MVSFNKLVVGRVYIVRDSRKGTYKGKLLRVTGEFATFEIIEGVARFVSEPDHGPGEQVNARDGLCVVTEV